MLSEALTEQWVMKTFAPHAGYHEQAVYPDGYRAAALGAPDDEWVCIGFLDEWFVSLKALYVLLEDGTYRRLPWPDIVSTESVWKKQHIHGKRYVLRDGSKVWAAVKSFHKGMDRVVTRCLREVGTCMPRNFVPAGRRVGPIGDGCEWSLLNRDRADEQVTGNLLLEVADLADQAILDGSLSDSAFAFMLQAGEAHNSMIGASLPEFMASIEASGIDVLDKVLRLAECKSVYARVRAVNGTWKGATEDFKIKLLSKGIADKHKQVRLWAAYGLNSPGLSPNVVQTLRPQIETALKKEKQAETKGQFERALGLS